MNVAALIPAKGFTNAKQRLSPLLGVVERELLAEAMLRDVLGQVVLTRGLDGVYVVTEDSKVSEIASFLGIHVIREESERGETEAVVFALSKISQVGIHSVLVIPGDIPLVRSSDIELLLEQISGHDRDIPFALLTPSHDRMGTNALLLSPPGVIKLRFGYDSFSYHLGQVEAAGLPPRVLENEMIALDIDEPKDLERFMEFAARVRGSCSPDEHDNRARARIAAGNTYERAFKMGVFGALENAKRSGRL
ncbi:MAG: 2-phospho-L-lactate guanylyltransferase [Deltaproteobacteria bacterium]|nr:2-phospho-L-lactate guanylyltransferase [Deltaproteobacteria bacterium]